MQFSTSTPIAISITALYESAQLTGQNSCIIAQATLQAYIANLSAETSKYPSTAAQKYETRPGSESNSSA